MILAKLPDWLITRWAFFVEDERTPNSNKNNHLAESTQESNLRYPGFTKFADFIAKQAKIAADPVLSLQAIREIRNNNQEKVKSHRIKNSKSFNTQCTEPKCNETSSEYSEPQSSDQSYHSFYQSSEEKKESRKRNCYYCKEDHFLSRCKEFRKMSPSERIRYLEDNNMCFRCLARGHNSNECRKTMISCVVCQGPHHSLVHSDSVPPSSSV